MTIESQTSIHSFSIVERENHIYQTNATQAYIYH